MRRIIGLFCICVGVCFVSWVVPAHATRVRQLTLTQTRDKAETVLVGTVDAATTRAGAEGKMVWTDYHVTVEETLLGAEIGASAVVSFAGGRHGTLDVGILGVPQLETGRRYVLFLLARNPYPAATVGWGQGIYQVAEIVTDSTPRTVLISYDHQPLELDTLGALFRGTPIEFSKQGWRVLSMQREDHDVSPKASDPLILDASGQPVPQVVNPPHLSAVPIADRDFADISHLRRFLNDELQESLFPGR